MRRASNWLKGLCWRWAPGAMWWIVDYREARFVAQALKRLDRSPVVYIHRDEGSPPTGVLTRPENLADSLDWDHDHVEGRARRGEVLRDRHLARAGRRGGSGGH